MKDDVQDIAALMQDIGANAKAALRALSVASSDAKNTALRSAATSIRQQQDHIIAENTKDMEVGRSKGLSAALLDRLALDQGRVESMAKGLEDVADLPDPTGVVTDEWERPNGLIIQRKRGPLGVIGVIYESRPNVTADAAALCLKAGNASILRGGSESFHSARAIMECLIEGLRSAGLPEFSAQLIPTTDRAAVGEMLKMVDTIDVIVPRGGKSLIERVSLESKVPLFKHLEGICHLYIHSAANAEMAKEIVLNAKMRRTAICGSAETVLIDRDAVKSLMPEILGSLFDAGCEVRGDDDIQKLDARVIAATEEDWSTEYLDSIISIKTVSGVNDAVDHIEKYGSSHTESIITDDAKAAETFLNNVDSAIVMHNASTQYADGGEFGMGAEIGISTGKLHARGPVGVEQLTSSKYVVRGTGQCRP
jgi:glutamate-5-semialdehyde dehydrogenase